jgi:hypothetical protein
MGLGACFGTLLAIAPPFLAVPWASDAALCSPEKYSGVCRRERGSGSGCSRAEAAVVDACLLRPFLSFLRAYARFAQCVTAIVLLGQGKPRKRSEAPCASLGAACFLWYALFFSGTELAVCGQGCLGQVS